MATRFSDITRNRRYSPCLWIEIQYLLSSLSNSGWISALTGLNKSIPVGIIMILIAALFTALAAMSLIMFKKVLPHTHTIPHHNHKGVNATLPFSRFVKIRLKGIRTSGIIFEMTNTWGIHRPHFNNRLSSSLFVALPLSLSSPLSLLSLLSLQVHGMYRTTGASFEKAQAEFATGVMANKTVQTAAATAASNAASGAFKQQI